MKKFSCKSIAFLMSLIMVCSIFAPVVASAAEWTHDDHNHKKDGPINYVSIGDSMTNGYGLDGYERSEEEGPIFTHANNNWYEMFLGLDPSTLDEGQLGAFMSLADLDYMYNVNGYLREVPGSYPVLFQQYLAKKNGWDGKVDTLNNYADLTQLGTSALRAEDIWYLMTYDSETDTAAWPGDGYTSYRIDIWDDQVNDNVSDQTGYSNAEMHKHYADAILNADVISLNVGANNFSTFMVERIKEYYCCVVNGDFEYEEGENGRVPYNSTYTTSNWDYIKAHLNAELEKDLSELYTKLEKLSTTFINDPALKQAFVDAGVEDIEGLIADLLDGAMYTSAGFAIAYKGIVDYINEVNPDAEIVIIGLNNWMAGMDVELDNGSIFPIGDILDELYHFANVYMAAIPAMYEDDDNCDLSFYYADVEGLVEMLVADVVKEDITNLTASRLADGVWWQFKDWENGPIYMLQYQFWATTPKYISEYKYDMTMREYIRLGCELLEEYADCVPFYNAALDQLDDEDDAFDKDTFMFAMIEATKLDPAFDSEKAMAVFALSEEEIDALRTMAVVLGADVDASRTTLKNMFGLDKVFSKVTKDSEDTMHPRELNFEYKFLKAAPMDAEQVLFELEFYYMMVCAFKEFAYTGKTSIGPFIYFLSNGNNGDGGNSINIDEALATAKEIVAENPFFAEAVVEEWKKSENIDIASYCYILVNYYCGNGVGCHPSATGHKTIADEMIKAYESGYTATDATIDALIGYAGKAYAYAYNKLEAEGKIDAAIAGLEVAIDGVYVAIDAIEALPENNQKALLIAELENTVATLEKAIELLEAGDLDTAWATLLTFEDDLNAHLETLKDLAVSVGYDIDPYLVKAYDALTYYVAVIDEIIDIAYDYADKIADTVTGINEAYLGFVEYAGSIADKLDPALGKAVREYLIDTPADVLAIIYAYGEEAVIKLITDVANATGEIYDVILGLAVLLENYGEEIIDIVTNDPAYAALINELKATKAELEELYANLKFDDLVREKIAALKEKLAELEEEALNAPISADYDKMKAELELEIKRLGKQFIYDSKDEALAAARVLKAELKDIYAALYDLVVATIDEIDPLVADMLADSLASLVDALEIIENTGVEYAEWLKDHFKPLAGELLASIIGNTEEFIDVAYPIIEAIVIDIIKQVNEFLGGLAEDLKDFIYGLEDEFAAIQDLIAKLEQYLKETNDLLGELLGVAEGNLIDKLKFLAENMDEIKASILKDLEAFINTGLYADYVTDADSFYLAITAMGAEEDAAHYAELLAEKLGVPAGALATNLRVSDLRALLDADYINDAYGTALFEMLDADAVREAYVEAIAMSDLITLDLGAADFTNFTTQQLLGYVVEQNKATIEELLEMLGDDAAFIDLSYFQAYDLDWTRFEGFVDYVDVEAILAEVEAKLVEEGVPAELEVVLTAEDLGITLPSIVTGAPEITLTLYPAETVMYAVECYVYAFVNYAYNYGATIAAIHEINPDAEVVVLGTFNAFDGLVIDLGDFAIDMTEIGDKVVAAMDAFALANVLAMENTTFVDIKDVETVLDATEEKDALSYVSLETLGFNEDAFTATADGHAYVAEQILKALTVTCAHAYDNVCDGECNICGEEREVGEHEYDNACDADCNKCGEVREVPAHVYDNACDADCNVCGETRTPAAHVYDNACDADCNVCGEKRTPAAHVYDNACDKDCNVCKATRTPAAHVYDNACDKDCNVCKETRTPAAHVYDNACDADCNVCGEKRTPADHVYDNACDKDCNVCKAERTPADHVYDNACDKDCNVCKAERTPADHVYDNACDADCNVCGEKRTPADHKYGEWKVVTEATKDAEGKKERTCTECGHVESEAIPMLDSGMPVAVIVVIVVVGVAGAGVGVFFILKKFSII